MSQYTGSQKPSSYGNTLNADFEKSSMRVLRILGNNLKAMLHLTAPSRKEWLECREERSVEARDEIGSQAGQGQMCCLDKSFTSFLIIKIGSIYELLPWG